MPRYKRRPTFTTPMPGLFDDIESPKSEVSIPVHPSIKRHAERVKQEEASALKAAEEPVVEPVKMPDTDGCMRFISFGSGSSGNCAYIGDAHGGVLVDAGVDTAKVLLELKRHGIGVDKIRGIVLTHDHSDHVRYAYTLLRRHSHIGLYCTPKTLNGLLRRHSISRRIKDYHRPIYKEIPFTVGNLRFTAFDVDHDGTDNMGFFVELGDHRFAIATDLGVVGARANYYMSQASYLMIESNYDARMLVQGRYPDYLKARIMADNGHLDNVDAAATVAAIASAADSRLRYVFLCHLSNDNNTPAIAIETTRKALLDRGLTVGDCTDSLATRDAQIQLMALPRFESTRIFIFR